MRLRLSKGYAATRAVLDQLLHYELAIGNSQVEKQGSDDMSMNGYQSQESSFTNSLAATKAKVAVIGAGPAGLSCALELLRVGYAVDIFELDSVVGGLSRTVDVLGHKADVGSHRFFSKVKAVNDFWHQGMPRMAPDDFITEHRMSRILYNGKFFDYPLRGFDALFKLGLVESTRCVLSYIYASLCPRSEPTFEAWVSNAFGHRLYEIFFKTYSERLWGIPCNQLSDQFAKQRIKTLNLRRAIINAIQPKRNKQGTPLSLIDEFIYPRLGCGMVYERVAEEIKCLGGHFFFRQKVLSITTERNENGELKATGVVTQEVARGQGSEMSNAPVEVVSGSKPVTRPYDIVVSSGIFTDMVRSLSCLPKEVSTWCDELRFRNTILVYLTVDPSKASLCPDHWIYIHSPEIQMGRLCDFSNWSKDMQQGHSDHLLSFEYWANDDEPLWLKSDAELIAQARVDAVKTGFITAESIIDAAVHRVYKSYPVYHNGYEQVLGKITAQLDTIKDLYFIGRNGSFKYNNMDHSILMGLFCAHKICGTYHGSLWSINTDSDYQEVMQQQDPS